MASAHRSIRAVMYLGYVLLWGTLAFHTAAEPAAGRAGCEPGAAVEMAARILGIRDQGTTARVLVEISITSQVPLSGSVLEGRRREASRQGIAAETLTLNLAGRARAGVVGPVGAGGVGLAMAAGGSRTVQVALDLMQGTSHHLIFSLSHEEGGESVLAEAYLPVPLDPEAAPELLDGLVQYRAGTLP